MTESLRSTQSQPEGLAQASDALRAVLLDDDLDLDAMLALGQALLVLHDVEPPYPPRPEPDRLLSLAEGVDIAVQGLALAAREASSPAQVLHTAYVARELRPVRDLTGEAGDRA